MAERRGSRVSFFGAGISEHRQPRPADDVRAGEQFLDHRPHGGGAQHQSLLARAGIEHAVGEHVTALEIGAELHLVDRHEGDVEVARHGLDGRHPEARIGRLDLLLAGDQRHRFGADPVDAFVVDLARQQPQRQADHAARMRQHALDGEVGLAGVGRPEHGGDAGAAGTRTPVGGLGKREGHYASELAAGLFFSRAKGFLYHNATVQSCAIKLWNEFGTNRARIADSARMWVRSRRHLACTAPSPYKIE